MPKAEPGELAADQPNAADRSMIDSAAERHARASRTLSKARTGRTCSTTPPSTGCEQVHTEQTGIRGHLRPADQPLAN